MNRYDPETMEGDYAEAWQIWHHQFNRNPEKTQECFKDVAYVPVVTYFHPEIKTPNWDKLAEQMKKSQRDYNMEKQDES